ncbi:hypothetical protein HMI56_005492, partial [Coelomomyces lativittatus]
QQDSFSHFPASGINQSIHPSLPRDQENSPQYLSQTNTVSSHRPGPSPLLSNSLKDPKLATVNGSLTHPLNASPSNPSNPTVTPQSSNPPPPLNKTQPSTSPTSNLNLSSNPSRHVNSVPQLSSSPPRASATNFRPPPPPSSPPRVAKQSWVRKLFCCFFVDEN